MTTHVVRHPLPLVRDLSLVFRLTDVTATLLVASSIAGLLYGPAAGGMTRIRPRFRHSWART